MLQVKTNQIIDSQGHPIRLRGACVGGWMNMEHFIDGYPGDEHGLRAAMAQVLGPDKAQFFFDRLLDYFFAEEDVAFIKSCGATVVRLALNYRHFERDDEPFKYLEAGFARLDRAVGWCAKHGLYAIFDLHAVQGWQNTDWHCDNSSRHAFFWQHRQFQDRFVALWEEFARRYKGNPAVAGYNVMNEPVTNAPHGRFGDAYTPDWDALNRVYRRVVQAIRAIDPDHIIFLEGDLFSSRFAGLDAPFAENLVYSSHNYNAAGFGPGRYPGEIGGERWDRQKQVQVFQDHEGTRFAQQQSVPLWVGEFGSDCAGPAEELSDRLRALDDQIGVFEEHGAHWTTWTYKDIGVMSWVEVAPEAEYLQRIAPILEAKRLLGVDFWLPSDSPALGMMKDLARYAEQVIGDPDIDTQANPRYLGQAALSGYVASLMQPAYARRFKGLSEAELDRVLQSFALKNCRPRQGLVDIIRKHGVRPA
jgi:aryl-phospho-beta-D-glucosidase BglC (GH1 family)